MYADGIRFASHKLTQGTNFVDPTCADAMVAFRDAGIPVLSTYHWLVPGSDAFIIDQAHYWLAKLDSTCPWWKDHAPFFLQADIEIQGDGGKPTPHQTKLFCDTVASYSPLLVVAYASAGEYGDTLAGIGHPLWNAHYGANPVGTLVACYQAQGGDNSAGYKSYSGSKPMLLQFGSKVTIGGLTTCDADAFPGTLDELIALIGDHTVTATPTTTDNVGPAIFEALVPDYPWDTADGGATEQKFITSVLTAGNQAHAAHDQSGKNAASLAQLATAVAAIPTTAAPAAPLSDADVARIATAVCDMFAARAAS